MHGVGGPMLPIQKGSSPKAADNPSTPGTRRGRKQPGSSPKKMWADASPTPGIDFTPTPWGAYYAPPAFPGFGPMPPSPSGFPPMAFGAPPFGGMPPFGFPPVVPPSPIRQAASQRGGPEGGFKIEDRVECIAGNNKGKFGIIKSFDHDGDPCVLLDGETDQTKLFSNYAPNFRKVAQQKVGKGANSKPKSKQPAKTEPTHEEQPLQLSQTNDPPLQAEQKKEASAHQVQVEMEVPAVCPPGCASRGSALHGYEPPICKPCAWYWKPSKCLNYQECSYCHLCPEGELKNRKKEKVAKIRAGEAPSAKKDGSRRVLELAGNLV